MILVNSGAFLSISSWFCELTELIFVMIPYISDISSTGYPQKRKGLWVMCSSEKNGLVVGVRCVPPPSPPRKERYRGKMWPAVVQKSKMATKKHI